MDTGSEINQTPPLLPSTADKHYSGKFQLRPGQKLHKALSIKALLAGENLNNYCINVLNKSVAPSEKKTANKCPIPKLNCLPFGFWISSDIFNLNFDIILYKKRAPLHLPEPLLSSNCFCCLSGFLF